MKKFTYLLVVTLLLFNIQFVKVTVASTKGNNDIENFFAKIDYNSNTLNPSFIEDLIYSNLTGRYLNPLSDYSLLGFDNNERKQYNVNMPNNLSVVSSNYFVPEVAITPSSLDFGTVKVGQTVSGIIQFHNNSGVDIEVNVLSNNSFVHVNPTAFVAKNGAFVNVNISMEVSTEGANSSQITFNTNHSTYPQFFGDVNAQGFLPSKISVSPNTFNVSLKYGEIVSKDIDISNIGAGVLNYSVLFEEGVMKKSFSENAGLYAGSPKKERSSNNIKGIVASNISESPELKNTKFAGEILSTISLPNVSLPTGMVWINGLLYIVDYGYNRLCYYNPNDGSVNIIAGLHSQPYGVTWDGSYLWIGNNNGIFYAYNLNGTYAGLSFQGPIVFYSSICFNDGLFYISGLQQTQIYKVDYTGAVQWSGVLPGGITGSQIIYVDAHNEGKIWAQPETAGLVYQISNDFSSIVQSVGNGFGGNYNYALTHNGKDIYSASGNLAKVIDDGIAEIFLWADTKDGSVEPGSLQKFSFNIDATNLNVGSYAGTVVINSNDLDNPQIKVPVYLTVTGQPEILVSSSNLDFGNTLVNATKTVNITIKNKGGEVLTLSNIASSISELSYSISTMNINPGQNAILSVYFSPSNIQNYSGIISFNTNDPNNPTYVISAQGIGSNASVKFNVKDGLTGNPVDNAVITFNGITYEEGVYTIGNLNAGSYSYSVAANSYNTYSASISVNQFEVTSNVNLIPHGTSDIIMNNGTVISNCYNTFYDPGYTGNYTNNLDRTMTILPPNPESAVKVIFQMFQLESGWDYLYVYDGINTSAPYLGTYSGNSLPPTFTATNPDGALTFRFTTDGSVVYAGWQALISCVDESSLPPLTFNIFDANLMSPISGAYIVVEGVGSGYTDLAGNLSLNINNGGSYSYSVVKDGYFESARTLNYPDETSVSVGLNRWPSITFIVKDPSGNPVSNALVEIGSYSGNTNISGEVVFLQAIPFNNYNWTISANGFQPISGEQFLGSENIVVNANFAVSLPTIRFNVTDEFSAPFANAQVTLDGNTIFTDGAGQALFQLNEPYLTHSWNVKADGYKSVSGEQYAGTSIVDVNVQLQQDVVDLTVTILDATLGTPLNDAVVIVNSTRYVTGIDGKLLFNGVPKGDYPVSVMRHTYRSFNETVTVSSDQLEIYLDKIQSVSLPYSESFNTEIPSNFSVYDVEIDNYEQVWSWFDANVSGGAQGELDAEWRDGISTVRLLLPPINTIAQSTINLSFRYFFNDYAPGMKVLIETSTNGNDWEPTGWEINSGNGNFGPEQITIPITSNTNSSNTYIAFTLTGDLYQLDDWYVDDIQVTQPGVTLYNASFTVYNNSTSEPLSGAEIALNGYGSLLTNNSGIAYFTNVPNGTYAYTVSKSGYNVYSSSITINNGNATAFVGLVPLSFYSLTINVLKQSDSTPIPGALVILSGANAAETNSQGQVVWTNLPSGTYSYTITKEGYNNYSGSNSLTYNRTLNRYLSQKYFEANFTVVDANSNPVQNALISVAGKISVVTNEFGQATVGNLENANYNFTIQKTGYNLYSSSFNISGANSNVNATLALSPAPQYSILFKVTKLDATPISNATVLLTGFGPVTTNVNGEVLFTNISGGSSLAYEVQQTNYLNSTGNVGPINENKQLVVVLKPVVVEKYQVTFNVEDASGTSLAGALVDLGSYGTGSTNGAGNVVFSNIEFTEQLPYQVSLAGYKTVVGNATVNGNTNVSVILPLLATTTYSVTFSVTNSTGGYVKGANVSLAGYGTLLTDNMGLAVFNQVNPQNGINYSVTMPPYSSLSGTVNVVNANIVQNLILSTNVYRALFTVTDQFGNPLEGVNVDVLGGGRAVTNVYGNAIIGGLSAGTYSYNVYMPNGTPMNGGFDITSNDLPIQVTLPRPTQTVTFTVKDEFGGVIQDANVELLGYGSKLTDVDGKAYYANVLPANNKAYNVLKSGYVGFNGVVNIENSSVEQNVVLNIVRHSVQFSVSAGSKSITDALITFNGVTNATGNYLFSNVIPGSGYAYSVFREGYITKSGTTNVNGFTDISVNLEVEKFMVTFNVSLPTAKVGQKSYPAKILIGGTTDTLTVNDNGSTNVSLPKGFYNFKVWADGCQPHYGSFEIVNTAINVSVTLKIPTGVDDSYLMSIKAYPNPFHSQISLDNCSEIKQIIVHNLIGQPIIDEKYSNNSRININTTELLPGVYFIKLIGNDGSTRAIRMIKN